LSGVCVGTDAGCSHIRVDGFFAGVVLSGRGERIIGPSKFRDNYYGVYVDDQALGDHALVDIDIEDSCWAGVGIAPSATLTHAVLQSVSIQDAPFGIYKEMASGAGPALDQCLLSGVSFTRCGNGNIFVSGAAGGRADVKGCLFQGTSSVAGLDASTAIPVSSFDARGNVIGRRIAPVDIAGGDWVDNQVVGTDPALLDSDSSPDYVAAVACGNFVGGYYATAGPGIDRASQDGKRFTTGRAPVALSGSVSVLTHQGATCRLFELSGSAESGDLLESAAGERLGARRSNASRLAIGVAMHGGADGESVPVACSGIVDTNCGTNAIAVGDPVRPDDSQPGCVVTTTVADHTIIGVAQSTSSGGRVQVMLQVR
jgi:hypothetical protein